MLSDTRMVILAGGLGTRLNPLTGENAEDRPKPLVPFMDRCLIDIVVSNGINTPSIRKIDVLLQIHSNKINHHLNKTFMRHDLGTAIDGQITPLLHHGEDGLFSGTFDAIKKSAYLLEKGYKYMLVASGDHIYQMDYGPLIELHKRQGAAMTVVVKKIPAEDAKELGVFIVDSQGKTIDFVEKPSDPPLVPGTNYALANLGIYIVSIDRLKNLLADYPGDDFGKHVIPHVIASSDYSVALFEHDDYWLDVGTIDTLWKGNMDLVGPKPAFNMYNEKWPIYHLSRDFAPLKGINGCSIHDAVICSGSIIAGSVFSSVLSTRTRVAQYSLINDSVLFDKVQVGIGVSLHRVIADKSASFGDGVILGQNPEAEAVQYPGIVLKENNIIVVPKGMHIGGAMKKI